MKKFILTMMCAVVMATVVVPAAAAQDKDSVTFKIENLIKQNVFANHDEIASLAAGLSSTQKQALFDANQFTMRKTWLQFGLNIGVGFGVGSFVVGDKTGGAVQCALDCVGLGCVIVGSVLTSATAVSTASGNATEASVTGASIGVFALSLVGYGCLTAGRVYGGVRPWNYRKSFNSELASALGVKNAQAVLVPSIDPVNDSYGLVAVVKF